MLSDIQPVGGDRVDSTCRCLWTTSSHSDGRNHYRAVGSIERPEPQTCRLIFTSNTVGKLIPGTGPVRELEPGWSGGALDARVGIRLSLAYMAMAGLSSRGSQSAAPVDNGLHLPSWAACCHD